MTNRFLAAWIFASCMICPTFAEIMVSITSNVSQTHFSASSDDWIESGSPFLTNMQHTSYMVYTNAVGATSSVERLNDGQTGASGTLEDTAFDLDGEWTSTYELDTSVTNYNLGEVRVVSAWEGPRVHQNWELLYSTTNTPSNFTSLGTFSYTGSSGGSVQLSVTDSGGVLASNVAAIRFHFMDPPGSEDEAVYREVDVFGGTAITPAPTNLVLLDLSITTNDQADLIWFSPGEVDVVSTFAVQTTTNLFNDLWTPAVTNLPRDATGTNQWSGALTFAEGLQYYRVLRSDAPMPPTAPLELTASGMQEQALLSWDAPTGGVSYIDGYKVEYRVSGSSNWIEYVYEATSMTKTTVTGLTNGTDYDFRVTATGTAGEGEPSPEITAAPRSITNLVFVFAGESNSGGIGLNSDATAAEMAARSSVQIMNLTNGLFDFEDLQLGVNNLRDHDRLESYYDTSHGFENELANAVETNALPGHSQVHLIKTGQGGSRIAQWSVGNAIGYWTKFLQRINAAKPQLPADVQWVVFYSQGINDGLDGKDINAWTTETIAHLDKIKAELPGAIIIMTQFQSMTGFSQYTDAVAGLAETEANVWAVDSTGADRRDSYHWSYVGLKTVTSRMVDITRLKLGL